MTMLEDCHGPLAGGTPVQRPVRPGPERADVAAVMALVWSLVRSGPNFDGRQVDVQRAVTAAIDNAVAAERERIKARLLGMDAAVNGRHNYYAHAVWVLFERA